MTENIFAFCITYRKGISARIAPAPAAYIFPRMTTAQTATAAAESSAGGKIFCISLPASIRTGAARKAFIPAYTIPPANARPVSEYTGETVWILPPEKNTKPRSTGTSTELKIVIPFVPRRTKNTATKSPASESKGFKLGSSASKPASIPAHGINESRNTPHFTAGAARRNSAFTALSYPPYFRPRYRYRKHSPQKIADDKITGRTKYFPRKKRTSSAPLKKPAPMLVPTIKKAFRSVFIPVIYALSSPEYDKIRIFFKFYV